MKLIDLLKEVGEATSRPYDWRQTTDEEEYKEYTFQTDSGLYYQLDIDIKEQDQERDTAAVGFGVLKPNDDDGYFKDYDETPSRGEVYKVMATVVGILKDFIKKNKGVKYLHFTTNKVGPGETKRLGLYKQYIQKHLPNADIETKNRYGAEVTTITLKEIGDTSSRPYDWKKTSDSKNYKEYTFKTKSGLWYQVEINLQKRDEELDTAFVQFGFIDPDYDQDNPDFVDFDAVPTKGDLFSIMATIVAVLKDLTKNNPNIKYLEFGTIKGKNKKDDARLNLYTRYIQKHLPNAKMSTVSRKGYEVTSIQLKEIGDASAKPYKFEKVYEDEYERTYGFETESGQLYNVIIDEIDPEDPYYYKGSDPVSKMKRISVRFYTVAEDPDAEEYDKVVNKGELFKVMATIVDILRLELKLRPSIEAIEFKPSKRKTQDKARLELYKRFFKNFYPNTEFKTYGEEVVAILKK